MSAAPLWSILSNNQKNTKLKEGERPKINELFQRAARGNAQERETFLRKHGAALSGKQRSILAEPAQPQAIVERRAQPAPATRSGASFAGFSAQQLEALRKYVDLSIQRQLLRSPISNLNSVRNSVLYEETWRQHGCPPDWPHPDPCYFGTQSLHRYVVIRCCTITSYFTLNPGEATVLLAQPKHPRTPLLALGNADAYLNTIDWDKNEALKDRTFGPTHQTCGWVTSSPQNLFSDANSVKAGDYCFLPSAATAQPLLTQVMGGNIDVEVCVPWDGQAIVRTMCEGDNHDVMGRGMQVFEFDTSTNMSYVQGVSAGLLGRMRQFYVPNNTSLSPIHATGLYSSPHVIAGNTSRKFTVPLLPEESWSFSAQYDATDAPDGGYTSTQNNTVPRSNIVHLMSQGCASVYNSGSAPVTVVMGARYTMAAILEQDDTVRGIPQLVSEMRKTAPALVQKFTNPDAHRMAARSSTGVTSTDVCKGNIDKSVPLHTDLVRKLQDTKHLSSQAPMISIGKTLDPTVDHDSWMVKFSKFFTNAENIASRAKDTVQRYASGIDNVLKAGAALSSLF